MIKVSDLYHLVSDASGISANELRSKCKSHIVSQTRFAIMYLAYTHIPKASYTWVARQMGYTDHTTIWHGVTQAKKMISECPRFAELIETCEFYMQTKAPAELNQRGQKAGKGRNPAFKLARPESRRRMPLHRASEPRRRPCGR